MSLGDNRGKVFQTEETACAEALRQEYAWLGKGSTRKLVWPECVSEGETASIGGERSVGECDRSTINFANYSTSIMIVCKYWELSQGGPALAWDKADIPVVLSQLLSPIGKIVIRKAHWF